MKAQDTAELSFTDVRVPDANRLGEVGQGFVYLMQNLAQERLSIAAGSVAGAEAALRMTVDYTKDRKAFGRPVANCTRAAQMLDLPQPPPAARGAATS